MSSFLRNIQRAAKRQEYYQGRGSKLGIPTDVTAADYVARIKREAKHA